jgi:hypothetical protein
MHRLLFTMMVLLTCVVSWTHGEVRIQAYAVDVPVAEQSTAERARASSEGLLIVLSRVTGLVSVPRTPEIVDALDNPGRFYSQFVFSEDDETNSLSLRVTFEDKLVLDLINRAGLPVWWSKRPSVLAWVGLDNGERRILDAAENHALLDALAERASLRGIPMELPLMDLSDSILVSEREVWAKAADALDAASARYRADLVLTGRMLESFSLQHGTVVSGDWEVWINGEPLSVDFSEVTTAQAAELAIDLIADHLFETYAVLSRELALHPIGVAGLQGAKNYAALMDYLTSLEFVDGVGVVSVTPQAIQLELASRASFDQLLLLLTHDGLLAEDAFYRGMGAQLVWVEGQAGG